MKKPGKFGIGIAMGMLAGVVSVLFLVRDVLDMHNRLSVIVCVLFPYIAIADRLPHPPSAMMFAISAWSLLQMPLYGGLLGRDWSRGKLSAVPLLLLALHALAAGYAIALKFGHFSAPGT